MGEPKALTVEEANACCIPSDESTKEFLFQQTMYRIKDPKKSLEFYTKVMGMQLLKKVDFPEMKFSLYSMVYEKPEDIPREEKERTE